MVALKDYVLDYTSELYSVIMEIESGFGGLTCMFAYGLEKISAVVHGVSGAGNAALTCSYPNGAKSAVMQWRNEIR